MNAPPSATHGLADHDPQCSWYFWQQRAWWAPSPRPHPRPLPPPGEREFAAVTHGLPYENARLPVAERVADLLGRMTLSEKVGQMTQTERGKGYDDATPITTWNLGSILSAGGSTPTERTQPGPTCRPVPEGGIGDQAAHFSDLASTRSMGTARCTGPSPPTWAPGGASAPGAASSSWSAPSK